jgi:hypothetical protein
MSNLNAAVDEIQTWADVFRELDQWDAIEKFAERHAQALDTRAGFRRFCSPKIGHLVAHDCGGFQIFITSIKTVRTTSMRATFGRLWALVVQRLRLY